MATLSFDGETHDEIVAKVKRWLASLDGAEERITATEAINASAELTKDALRIIAAAAPEPIAQSEVAKGLTAIGYQAADAGSKALIDALDALSAVTGDAIVKRARDASAKTMYEMNSAIAKQMLRSLRPPKR
jgi:hypothetical protein